MVGSFFIISKLRFLPSALELKSENRSLWAVSSPASFWTQHSVSRKMSLFAWSFPRVSHLWSAEAPVSCSCHLCFLGTRRKVLLVQQILRRCHLSWLTGRTASRDLSIALSSRVFLSSFPVAYCIPLQETNFSLFFQLSAVYYAETNFCFHFYASFKNLNFPLLKLACKLVKKNAPELNHCQTDKSDYITMLELYLTSSVCVSEINGDWREKLFLTVVASSKKINKKGY